MRQVWSHIQPSLLALLFTCALAPVAWGTQANPLVFLHYWSGPLGGGVDEMVQAYNRASPDYKVHASAFDHESFKVSIKAMLASDSPPDIFSYWAGAKVRALVAGNHLAPIDEVWNESKLYDVFPSSIANACTYFGHKYALPVTQHYVGFFYNKKIFDQYHLEPPINWEEFLATCEKLKNAGITPLALGSKERWPAQFWFDYLLLRTAGPEFRHRLMDGKVSYNSPEVAMVFEEWKSLMYADYFNSSPNLMDWTDAASMVHSGSAAMTLMGTWVIGYFQDQLKWKQETDFDFFPFPLMDRSVPATSVGPIDVMVVSRKGRNQEVNAILAFFSDPGPQMEMSSGSGALSPSRAIPPGFYTKLQRRILETIRNTPNWAFNYDLATPPEVADLGLDAFKLFLYNPKEYRQIIIELDKKAEAYFNNSAPN
ncbi:extracellular solute-binding protein [Pseudodesulfovibrio sp. zrk46]|uniref:ABC transporter substrate-binding protein n=1 Tax=Pseudodesulfovibrio sp. zrk46 TaxID=2725288 RepID=UPI00144A04E2|nr:extracellular solute-binding protein [Pseudodesulfovibrio sp. zrk46]QJB55414.1 extracellular solute-binding protein [Pseudodesulfovibrio sp. zrk46]